jgi:hypothetical protein
VATSKSLKGKGIATHLFRIIENLCIEQNVFSIKVDTNFDNVPMLKILNKLNYTYCGEVFFNGAPRHFANALGRLRRQLIIVRLRSQCAGPLGVRLKIAEE